MSRRSDHAATVQRIAAEESAKFLDSNFGQLDTSGCVSLLTAPSEESQLPDPRFAPLDDRGAALGASALRQGIEDLVHDSEVQEQVARETGDPELLEDYLDRKAETTAREFKRLNRGYYRCPENWEKLVKTLAYNALEWEADEATALEAQQELVRRGYWTLENLTAAYEALSKAGALEVAPNQPRNLSDRDRRAIALRAANGDVEGAISDYLLLRASEESAQLFLQAPSIEAALYEIADPDLARIVREAVWFCWENGRPNYSPTPERRRFMQEYAAGRIPTACLLDEAWTACQQAEKDRMRSSLLRQIETESRSNEPDLDALSDDEIDRLYHRTLRKIAVDSRREAQC